MRLVPFWTACVLLGCGGQAGGDANTLTYFFSSDPRSLDPALSTDVPTGEMVALLFDNLIQVDADGDLRPGLARRWTTDTAGRVYALHLRTDAHFHDGRPVRATDVGASLRRALAPGTSGGRGWPLYPIAGARAYADGQAADIEGLDIPNDSTVILTLEEPLNIFPKLLAMPVAAIVPAGVGPDFGETPIGSGPWRFVSWSHDDEIVLARNPTYWGGVSLADSLRIRIIPEPLTQAAEYEAGNLSVVEVPFGETRQWEERHSPELLRRPALRVLYVALNTRRGPLRDPRVRVALNLAVDRGTLLRTVAAGRGVLSAGSVPPGLAGYDSTRTPYPFDQARARALLTEAGYRDGFAVKLWRTSRPVYSRIAQTIQQQLGAVGVQVEIVERDAAAARAAARNGEADLFLTDWYGDYPDPENFSYPLFHSSNLGAGGNLAFLQDPDLDRMLERARATPDPSEKVELTRAIDFRVFELAPWIFAWFPVDLWAMRPDVIGWRIPAIFNGQRWLEARIVP